MHDSSALEHYTFDPFALPLQELHEADTGARPITAQARAIKLDQLMEDEAQELAWGLCHVTIVHGDTTNDPVNGVRVDELHEELVAVLAAAEWSRITGLVDHHLRVAVGGADADLFIERVIRVARRRSRGDWDVRTVAVPTD